MLNQATPTNDGGTVGRRSAAGHAAFYSPDTPQKRAKKARTNAEYLESK